jgi:hypothetical protein
MQGCSAAGCASGCCRDQKRAVAPFRRPKTFTQMEPAEKKHKRDKRNTAFSNRGKQIPISKNINSKQETALIRVLLPQRTAQVRLIILTTIDNRNRAETSGCNSPHLNLQCDKNKLPIKSMSSACSMYKRSVETLWPKRKAKARLPKKKTQGKFQTPQQKTCMIRTCILIGIPPKVGNSNLFMRDNGVAYIAGGEKQVGE